MERIEAENKEQAERIAGQIAELTVETVEGKLSIEVGDAKLSMETEGFPAVTTAQIFAETFKAASAQYQPIAIVEYPQRWSEVA